MIHHPYVDAPSPAIGRTYATALVPSGEMRHAVRERLHRPPYRPLAPFARP